MYFTQNTHLFLAHYISPKNCELIGLGSSLLAPAGFSFPFHLGNNALNLIPGLFFSLRSHCLQGWGGGGSQCLYALISGMADYPELISQQSLEIKISGSVTFSESPQRVMDSSLAHSSSSYHFEIHPVFFIYLFLFFIS